ncbi:4'-phosphopantetheinyl transferase family protein [Streptomyces sp. BH097]|uniref:4'-phosphopantetheinyl transferase family protein n=1 Tax=unclassified Streptomyces TaxID=2593676 RepID=UPI003BB6D98A
MIEEVLPPGARWGEAFRPRAEVELFPEESAYVAGAVERRRLQFASVRACARDALAALGRPAAPLVPGRGGAPTWPSGVVGSMTHCTGYHAAAVAHSSELAALGIDAEPHAPLTEGVLESITGPAERASLPSGEGVAWDRVLFSAKESVYKAWFPATGRWLGFRDVEIALAEDGGITAVLLVPGPRVAGRRVERFRGRWTVGSGLLLTSVSVPVEPAAP